MEELENEGVNTDVISTSKAIVYPDDDAAKVKDGIELSTSDCSLLFANSSTIERFLETLEDFQSPSLILFDLNLPDSIIEELERGFVAVDEG